MKSLTVNVNYSNSEHTTQGQLPLPIRALDAEGSLLATGTACTGAPAVFELPEDVDPVFVRLTWPSGRTETKRVAFEGRSGSAFFTDEKISHNEWGAWAIPRLGRSAASASIDEKAITIGEYRNTWLRWWKFENGWNVFMPKIVHVYKSDSAQQLDLELGRHASLLQIGGPNVPWKFVSLPQATIGRVLLTPNSSSDPRADPLKTVVTGFQLDVETLLEFLSRDAIHSATALAQFGPVATRLLSGKAEDPIAALAGAYFLLRVGGWQGREAWFENLFRLADWTPDSALILCTLKMRNGVVDVTSEVLPLLETIITRGTVPLFGEGFTLMQEVVSLLRDNQKTPKRYLRPIIKILAARAWSGAMGSFYGVTPNEPEPQKYIGHIDQPHLRDSTTYAQNESASLPKSTSEKKRSTSKKFPKRRAKRPLLKLRNEALPREKSKMISGPELLEAVAVKDFVMLSDL